VIFIIFFGHIECFGFNRIILPSNTSIIKIAQKIVVAFVRFKLAFYGAFSTRAAGAYALKLFLTPLRNLPKSIPSVFGEGEKIELKLGPHRLIGYRWNHPQKKKAMILHGFSSTILKFDHFVKPLTKLGYEVIAIDAPAHGKSSGKQTTVLEYKAMIEKVHHTLGPIDAFIAHSFGGLALSLFLEHLPGQENIKAVLIAPATETSTAIETFCRFLKINHKVKQKMEALILDKSGMQAKDFSISRAASQIKASVLWIHDEDDEVTPLRDAIRVKDAGYSNFQFMITQTLGHRKIYRDNKVKKTVFEFLS
jgi:alpha-beta hydrolase superfamily lysophospholipase